MTKCQLNKLKAGDRVWWNGMLPGWGTVVERGGELGIYWDAQSHQGSSEWWADPMPPDGPLLKEFCPLFPFIPDWHVDIKVEQG